MKSLINISIISLLILSCKSNYEFIDETTRFNNLTGEVEVLQSNGKWIEKQIIDKKQEHERIRKQILPEIESSKIHCTGGVDKRYNGWDDRFKMVCDNNSNWMIEEINLKVDIFYSPDSTFLTTKELTFLTNSYIPNNGPNSFKGRHLFKGRPFTQFNVSTFIELSNKQYYEIKNLIYYGYKVED